MVQINFQNVSVKYPVYNAEGKSLRNQMVNIATGGLIKRESRGAAWITALDNLNFELHEGDAVGLIGHNGAGKTTLLRTMAGVYPPSSGQVTRSGKTSLIVEPGAGMEPELSGRENIIRMGLLRGFGLAEIKARLPEIASFTGLGSFLGMPVRTYSAGMMMRLMFAVATCDDLEILLIDEMFSTGDSDFQEKASSRMRTMIRNAKIFVFASHDLDMLRKYCKTFISLEHGKIVDIGTF